MKYMSFLLASLQFHQLLLKASHEQLTLRLPVGALVQIGNLAFLQGDSVSALVLANMASVEAHHDDGRTKDGLIPTKRIQDAINRLGSSKFEERIAAERELLEAGLQALRPLKLASINGTDLEVRRRAEELIRKITQLHGTINPLSTKEIAEGWILLSDAKSMRGWKAKGAVSIQSGVFVLGGAGDASLVTNVTFGRDFEVRYEYRALGEGAWTAFQDGRRKWSPHGTIGATSEWARARVLASYDPTTMEYRIEMKEGKLSGTYSLEPYPEKLNLGIGFMTSKGTTLELRNIRLRPGGLKILSELEESTGWRKELNVNSTLAVTPHGYLSLKGGPGEFQTFKEWDNFILQVDCMANWTNENGVVSVRSICGLPGSGYRVPIGEPLRDGAKQARYGTGSLAELEVAAARTSLNNEWLTITISAQNNHLSVWCNGLQTVDFIDKRPTAKSACAGCRLDKGCISIQGLGPGTDMTFRKFRIIELPSRLEMENRFPPSEDLKESLRKMIPGVLPPEK